MPIVKVTTWNIERMHRWFSGDSTTAINSASVRRQVSRAAAVINDIRPHILCIQEGPSRIGQMRAFFDEFVNGDWDVTVSDTRGAQRAYIVYRDFSGLESINEIDFIAPAWRYPFFKHNEETRVYNQVNQNFTRLPVEVIFSTTGGSFSVMCLHLKSKFSREASRANSNDPETRSTAVAEGLEQRARILQEGKLIREYIQDHPFDSDLDGRTIVAGDLNDGPGIDFFENRFFGLDILRRIRGDIDHPERLMTDIIDMDPAADSPFTAVFFDVLDRVLREVLLDHILVPPQFLNSSGLRVVASTGKVETEIYLDHNDGDWSRRTKPDRDTYPSDHRPASVIVRF